MDPTLISGESCHSCLAAFEHDRVKMSRTDTPSPSQDDLPFVIELWGVDNAPAGIQVLARAQSVHLAREIFKAATTEHPERRIVLRKGKTIIADMSA